MSDASKIEREQKDYYAIRRGYNNAIEYRKEYMQNHIEEYREKKKKYLYDKGICGPRILKQRKLWKSEFLCITNKSYYSKQFRAYELSDEINKLKELYYEGEFNGN